MTREEETALKKLKSLKKAFEAATPPGQSSEFRSLALATTQTVRCLEQGARNSIGFWFKAIEDKCTDEPYKSQVAEIAQLLKL